LRLAVSFNQRERIEVYFLKSNITLKKIKIIMPPSSNIMEDIHPIPDRSETVNLDNHRNTEFYKKCYEVVEYIVNKRLGKKTEME